MTLLKVEVAQKEECVAKDGLIDEILNTRWYGLILLEVIIFWQEYLSFQDIYEVMIYIWLS